MKQKKEMGIRVSLRKRARKRRWLLCDLEITRRSALVFETRCCRLDVRKRREGKSWQSA